MATVSPAWRGASLGPMHQAQTGTAEGSWVLGLPKVLWRKVVDRGGWAIIHPWAQVEQELGTRVHCD